MGSCNGSKFYPMKPFIPVDDEIHNLFPNKRYAFFVPSFMIVAVTTSVMGFMGYVLIIIKDNWK